MSVSSAPERPGGRELISRRAQIATLTIITLVVCANYVDRYVLAILIEPIRAELHLTDTQIGLLTGAGFALLYATLAIPVARLAERYSRKWILIGAVLLWSAATALSGFASGFALLLIARMLVGCGESGAMAPSLSMISDLFPIERRSTAMAVVGLGAASGSTVASWLGGWLHGLLGWRSAFVAIGMIGIPLALLLVLFVPEPKRGLADGTQGEVVPLPIGESLRRLIRRRSFAYLALSLIFVSIGEYSLILWMPALFHRSFGVDPTQLGPRLAAFQGIPIFVGTFLGGFLADRFSRRDGRWTVWVPMASVALAAVAVLGLCAARDINQALWLLIAPSFASGAYVGPCFALVQNLAAVHSRATATAIMVFTINLIGAGVGPLLLGALSSELTIQYGEESLRYAFYSLVPIYGAATLGFALMSSRVRADLEDARLDTLRTTAAPS